MVLRPTIRWSQICRRTVRMARGPTRRTGQQVQRRTYASEGGGQAHGEHESGSDLPWAITSAVVTIPAVWYLLQPQLNASSHGGGHGHGEHDEHGGEGHDVEEGKGEHSDGAKSEEATKESGDDGSDERESGGQGREESKPASDGVDSSGPDSEGEQDTPASSDDEGEENVAHEKEGGGNVEGVRFKGAMSGGTKEGEQGDTRKHIPDAKGSNKKRIESHSAITLGGATEDHQNADNEDTAAASKPAGGMNTQSGKQEGLSNTDTKHSTDIGNDPEKSKKGDGTPETAKSKGTVDPYRP